MGKNERCLLLSCILALIHMLNHTAKKELSLVPSELPQAPLAHSRPTERGNQTKSSESLPIRKRKHPSPNNTDDDSKPTRKRKPVTVIASQPGGDLGSESAHTYHTTNREDPPSETPPHPPIEQIEMWVPTPTAKFGPPKRKHAAARPRGTPKERRTDSIVSTVTSVPSQSPLTVSKQPVGLSESQIIALREEEEESQSQLHRPVSSPRPPDLGSPGHDSAPSGPLKSPTEDARDKAGEKSQEVQDNHPTNQLSTDNQSINRNADTAHVSGLRSKAQDLQDSAMDPPIQGRSENSPRPALPGPTRKSLVNPEVPTVIASTKSPLPEKQDRPHAKSPPSSVEQLGLLKARWLQRGTGSFAERRAFEARARLDLVRRGAAHPTGNLVEGQSSTIVPQIVTSPPPHAVLQLLNRLEARLQPVTENPTMSKVPPSEVGEAGPSAVETKEDMVTQDKSDRNGATNVSPHDNEVIPIPPCDNSVSDTSPTAKSAG